MSRYIDANSLICNLDKGLQGTARDYLKFFVMAINDQPTADVAEVKHGEWKHYPECSSRIVEADECSRCGFNFVFGGLYNYCPNCGAKMGGGISK